MLLLGAVANFVSITSPKLSSFTRSFRGLWNFCSEANKPRRCTCSPLSFVPTVSLVKLTLHLAFLFLSHQGVGHGNPGIWKCRDRTSLPLSLRTFASQIWATGFLRISWYVTSASVDLNDARIEKVLGELVHSCYYAVLRDYLGGNKAGNTLHSPPLFHTAAPISDCVKAINFASHWFSKRLLLNSCRFSFLGGFSTVCIALDGYCLLFGC